MRIARRVAQDLVEAVQQPLGHGMLEDFSLLVHLIPGETQGLVEVGLQQPMPTHHTEGDGTPLAGQAHTPVTLVSDQPLAN